MGERYPREIVYSYRDVLTGKKITKRSGYPLASHVKNLVDFSVIKAIY